MAQIKVKVKVEVILRSTVSRSVCLGIRPQSEARDQFMFLSAENILRHLRLLLAWVCNLLVTLLLDLASAVTLESKSRRT
jgi:hypothetical protein